MDKRTLMFGFAAVALMALAIHFPAFAATTVGGGSDASSSGAEAKATLEGILTGNIGLFLGLGITVLGLWTWIIGQKTGAGIIMIIGGVLLTLAPGLFNGVREMAGGVVNQFSGDGGTSEVK